MITFNNAFKKSFYLFKDDSIKTNYCITIFTFLIMFKIRCNQYKLLHHKFHLAWAGLGWPGLAWAWLGWPGLGWPRIIFKQF
jgi:hypothetical protein